MDGYPITDILNALPTRLSKKDSELVTRAYDFALNAHKEHTRFSGEPYFIHVFETAKTLARYEMDAETIAAGFLHDTVEDTAITDEELEKEFGKEIASLVRGVTKLGKVKYQGHTRHVESLRKFLIALAQDYRVLIIKLADRLHNLKTLEHVRPDKQRRIALESIEVYAPLADRLGIGKFKGEIEDAAFPYAYPKEYKEVAEILATRSGSARKSLEQVYKKLVKELATAGIAIKHIDYRIKHAYSLWKKLQKYDMNIDNIYDIVALRVVVESIEQCYHVLGIVHATWHPLPMRIKDYIALPKPNGYQSLHTTIFTGDGGIAEIQIRTEAMHARAEYGIASHYLYKESPTKKKQESKPSFEWVAEFKKLDQEEITPDKFLKDIKTEYFSDRIFLFTPKGEVIDLPKDATPIDFAYAIHSDIGNSTAGAKVDGKLVSLDTKLHSGSIVEIQTRKDGAPKSKWLDFVKTGMAKKHIRIYLNEHKEPGFLSRVFPRNLL